MQDMRFSQLLKLGFSRTFVPRQVGSLLNWAGQAVFANNIVVIFLDENALFIVLRDSLITITICVSRGERARHWRGHDAQDINSAHDQPKQLGRHVYHNFGFDHTIDPDQS